MLSVSVLHFGFSEVFRAFCLGRAYSTKIIVAFQVFIHMAGFAEPVAAVSADVSLYLSGVCV
jgi:hypothetical protein